MTEKERHIGASASDPAEVKPELDDAWFTQADAYVGEKLVRRGRPRSDHPKQPISIRLDPDVIEWFKRTGEGWQTRINDALRKAAGI